MTPELRRRLDWALTVYRNSRVQHEATIHNILVECNDALSSTAGQAPGHTDLIVTPESIDAFMEANPLPGGQEWRDISTRPDGDEPCWIAHAPSKTRVVGYPARGLPKGVWRLMWTAKMLSWTPTHWMPLPALPVAEPIVADKSEVKS